MAFKTLTKNKEKPCRNSEIRIGHSGSHLNARAMVSGKLVKEEIKVGVFLKMRLLSITQNLLRKLPKDFFEVTWKVLCIGVWGKFELSKMKIWMFVLPFACACTTSGGAANQVNDEIKAGVCAKMRPGQNVLGKLPEVFYFLKFLDQLFFLVWGTFERSDGKLWLLLVPLFDTFTTFPANW